MSDAITCACGAVTGRVSGAEGTFHACHCSTCRKWSGGVYMAVSCESVAFDNGSTVKVWISSDWGERVACGTCGSALVWRTRDGSHHSVSMHAFEDPSRFVFGEELLVDEKPANYAFAGNHQRLTRAEAMERHSAGQEA